MQFSKMFTSVMVTACLLTAAVCPAWAQDTETDKAKALLQKGIQQYDLLDFTEAKATLLKVDSGKLAKKQAKQLDLLLAKVDVAITRQASGFEDFRSARQALKDGNLEVAAKLLRRVLGNEFIPEPQRLDAKAELAVVDRKIEIAKAKEQTEAAAAEAKAKTEAQAAAAEAKAKAHAEAQAAEAKATAAQAEAKAPTPPTVPVKTRPETAVIVPTMPQQPTPAAEAPVALGPEESPAEKPLVAEIKPESVVEMLSPQLAPTTESIEPKAVVEELKSEELPGVSVPAKAVEPPKADQKSLRAQAKEIIAKAEANKLVEQADMALEIGNARLAAQLYNRALALVPQMARAQQGLAKSAKLMERAPATDSLTVLIQQRKLVLQQARVDFGKAVRDAQNMLATAERGADFASAAERARYAMSVLENQRTHFPAEEYTSRKIQAQDLADRINGRTEQWNKQQVAAKLKEVSEKATEREQVEREQRQTQVRTLLERIRVLESQFEFRQALDLAEEVIRLDPGNPVAAAKLDSLRVSSLAHRQNVLRKQSLEQEAESMVELEEAGTPWHPLLQYSDRWPDITSRRSKLVAGADGESPADREVHRILQKRHPKFEFDENDLETVIGFFVTITNLNITPRWNILEEENITKTTPVSIQLTDVTYETALQAVLSAVSTGYVQVSYIIEDGRIIISTKEQLAKVVKTVVYNVSDLLMPKYGLEGPTLG
ncbi:MAG: hypothetical protein HQ546_10795, partial [Planctomycetes bacterium]|nr:hypothetical protein [Planctomycetota bacterium]